MRLRSLLLITLVSPATLLAQGSAPAPAVAPPKPYQFTIEDYSRAERMVAPTAFPLVSGTAGQANWLPDGRFYYRATTADGSTFFLVDPLKKTRTPAFDHTALAG